MTGDRGRGLTDRVVEDLGEIATDRLAASDAMDPKQATREQSIAFLERVEFWVSSQLEALREELR